MNQRTAEKIRRWSDRIHRIHASPQDYEFIIPLLDEPYQLALKILDCGIDNSPYEIGKQLSINWQTVKQIQKALS